MNDLNRTRRHEECPVCGGSGRPLFRLRVLDAHDVQYFECPDCGAVHTEPPYWLEEAYRNAIADTDTGLVKRNLDTASRLSALLSFTGSTHDGRYLDLGGGYGLLVRLMRDRGFDFFWSDPYCENRLARGFEHQPGARYAAATAFEVLEHQVRPLEFLRSAVETYGVDTLVTSTAMVHGECSPDWWYLAPDVGQHIVFFRPRTMEHIAEQLGMRLVIQGDFQMLTRRPVSRGLARLCLSSYGRLAARVTPGRRRSLIAADAAAVRAASPHRFDPAAVRTDRPPADHS